MTEMIRNDVGFTIAIFAGLVVLLLSATTSRAVAQAPFDLPPTTGRYRSRHHGLATHRQLASETFSGSGEFRQVEVLAWYPAAAPAAAPSRRIYARGFPTRGVSPRSSAPRNGVRRTGRRADACPDRCDAWRQSGEVPASRLLARLHGQFKCVHRAAGRSREPRLRGAQPRPSIRSHCGEAG